MLSILLKKYFTYVSMAQSLALNTIGGLIFSVPFFFGVESFRSAFGSEVPGILLRSSTESIVHGCKIMLIIFFGFIVGNCIMYLLCKSIRRNPLELVDETQCLKQGIKVIAIFLYAVCSLRLFLLLLVFIVAVAFEFSGM